MTQEQRYKKNCRGLFSEEQIDLAFRFYTKEKQSEYSFIEWLNIFWNIA